MLMHRLCRAFAAVALSLISVAAAAEDTGVKGTPFSSLVAFSGSLSDTGNYASVNGDFPPPYYNNRTTNGPAAIDILADRFLLSAAPSLHLTGQRGGNNYAVLHANAYGDSPIDLPAQLRAYLARRNNVADPKALYFIFIGANDIVRAVIEPDDQKSQVILTEALGSVETAFRKLHAAGARMFYAPNNVDLGITPVTRDAGVSARATHFTKVFNRMWEQKLRQLERELDVPIFRLDVFRLISDMLEVGGTLGFTDVTHACLPLSSGNCKLSRFAFLTELLPTARIHRFLGNALAEGLMQQLGTPECVVEHRCGRRHDIHSYAVIDRPSGASND